jgi:hypothetical protein
MGRLERILIIALAACSMCALFLAGPYAQGRPEGVELQRLTFSKDDVVSHPSMDEAGRLVVYRQEALDIEKGGKTASIRVLDVERMISKVIFSDRTVQAPAPHDGQLLVCGTKPPVISGDGRKVAFSAGLGTPIFLDDHYLCVANSDGTDLKVIPIRNEELAAKDWKKLGFLSDEWRTISQYRISDDGQHIACLVKGHLGARDVSMPSGVLVVRSDGSGQRTLLAPKWKERQWSWEEGFPRNPFTNGGWVFELSGDGKKLVFGAQSSAEAEDYDIYLMALDGKGLEKIAAIRDRWIVRGDVSRDAKTMAFFYSGRKMEGMGTYALDFGKKGLHLLRSKATDRVDFREMSSDGRKILHRVQGVGLFAIGSDGSEIQIFDERSDQVQGIKGGVDFPSFPSFWGPRFVSSRGDRILLEALPVGKDRKEIFMARIVPVKKEAAIVCPACGRPMEQGWRFCPYDGTQLSQETR